MFASASVAHCGLLCLILLPASWPAQATQQRQPSEWSVSIDILPERLDGRSRATALRALHVALDQLSDGATLIWRKKSLGLEGAIRPTAAFRNRDGQICRRLTYQMKIGDYAKRIDGIACRQIDGSWSLSS
jgi:surface antigen